MTSGLYVKRLIGSSREQGNSSSICCDERNTIIMGNQMDQNLLEKIKLISEEAAHTLHVAAPNDQDILSLTREDLNELLPGAHNFQVRKQIMGLIKEFSQEPARQSMDSVPADVMSLGPEVSQSKVLCTESDKKQQQMATLDTDKPNNSNDNKLHEKDNDPAGEERVSDPRMTVPGTEHSSGPSGENKPVILVFMHRCRDPSHMTKNNCLTKCQPSSNNEVHIFHCAYHDSVGLLECQENEQVVNMVRSALLSYADSQAEIPQSSVTYTQQDTEQQSMATNNAKTLNITKDDELHRGGTKPVDEGSDSEQRMTVPAMEHPTSHSGGHALEVFQSNVDHTNVDMEVMPMAAQDGKSPNITNDSEVLRTGTDPAGEESESDQKTVESPMEHSTGSSGDIAIPGKDNDSAREKSESDQKTVVSPMEHSTGSSGGRAPEVLQSNAVCTHSGLEQKPISAKDGKRPHKSSKKETSGFPLPGIICQFLPSQKKLKYSTVKVHITRKTDTFMKKLNLQIELCSEESCSVILVFCPFPCQTGTDKQEAMSRVTGMSAVSLTGAFSQLFPSPKKRVKVQIVVAGETFNTRETFIEKLNLWIEDCSPEKCDVILVFCPVVSRIGTDMEAAMARVTVNKPVIMVFMHHCHDPSHMTNITVQPSRSNIVQVVHCAFHESRGLLRCQENDQAVKAVRSALLRYVDSHDEVPQPKVPHTQPVTVQQPIAAQGDNSLNITNDSELPGKGTDPAINVPMLVAGETFQAHETFIQKLKLQIEQHSAVSSNVILVFCPVVSQIGTDMEAAMKGVPEDKPVILVFMHHCHSPSHMTNITVQPFRRNIVQIVHCAFHETKGLLECQENEQAVNAVRSALLRNVDVQAEVSLTQSEIEQQSVAAQNANRPIMTNEVPWTGTKPMTEERESGQRMIVPAKGHSIGPSGGTSLLPKTGRFSFSKPNWNISSESFKSHFSRSNPNPNKLNNSSLVKVHMLVVGETFQAHETFIQKLKLQIELCSAESSNIILVFCPVVSQIRTDMEAAMARVTEDKPVILVFMHHCHNPSHMTDITVQPSRRNIVQVVHCAYHETKGLLQCQENDQAVDAVQEKLKKCK